MKTNPLVSAFTFPGQGSQSVGMGKELSENFSASRHVFQEVDDALSFRLSRLMFEGPLGDLTLTENAQPAIMAVSLAIIAAIESEGKTRLQDLCCLVAGHSLGEYSALAAAKALSVSDTAKILRVRGRAMQNAVPLGEGAMAALLGLSFDEVKKIAEESNCETANDNAEGQVVVSGKTGAVEKAVELAMERGAKRALKLPVSAPFHCSLMEPAARILEKHLADVNLHTPSVPMVSNVTAEEISSPPHIKNLLVKQVTAMVRWRESVKYLRTRNVEKIFEIGNGKVLSGLAKRIEPDMAAISIQTPQDIEEFLKNV